ncbi:uncharacterized protein MYCFIDRAFT_50335 [Pseudocercospora fijiensis CIRAD86]|uniref:Oxidase ustYa n=1 Tax=Pseudocercospora fijiensis (strain CIRAD86) TaxID=383855 RepID=M2YVT0_PSEFD|nr:uncharacterized protein MYCFIDRAFT_50335 [Pseudocercospora fijiensis CIRAD86]EME81795.1 hypothetical protein MYCFIDRAFT_50335 [Pseudocercospora fijiensis CIRAD86]
MDPTRSIDPTCDKWERKRLLEASIPNEKQKEKRWCSAVLTIALLLLATLLSTTLAAVLAWKLHYTRHPHTVAWFPPDVPREQTFKFQPIFGANLSDEAERAWTKLIPKGKGFVHINNESPLDPAPGLDLSLPHQRAMVAVFHQLHCLYMTRSAYFSARAGNFDDVHEEHLSHCWDYLRQTLMCAGDTTLEWVGAPPHDLGSSGWGYRHQCRDYAAIYTWAEKHRLTNTKKIHT